MKQLTRILNSFLTASLLVVLVLGIQPISRARAESSTYTVNILGDPGDGTCGIGTCTLRDAILAANANVGADTIVFSVSGTIILSSALPNISEDLTMDGRGQTVVINGGNLYQVLIINSGKTATLNTLTIQNGKSGTTGGGINNNGMLTIKNSTFTGNQAFAGGGSIHNSGTLTVENSTFSTNSAHYGGGISNTSALTISNSTFFSNNATTIGGGVYNENGTLTVTNGTFYGNSATTGGGIYNNTGATLNYANTILANSTAGGDCWNEGTVFTNNHNLVRDGSCFTVPSDDPKLGTLADNGGPTQTMELLTGSPALDAGDNGVCAATPINNLDQRGVTRPLGPHCDIGAYEATFVPVVNLSPSALDFGDQMVGTTSAAQDVVLTYTGAGSLEIGTLSLSGEFAFASNTCDGASLSSFGQCTFSVTFAPTSTGAKTGAISISSNAVSTPDSLALTGTGVSPAVGLSAATLMFAPQFIGTTSATQTVTVTNIGTGNLIIGILRVSGDFALRTNTCNGASLPAAGTCQFRVAFSPTISGTRTGAVSIPSNAPTLPNRVTLRGTVKAGTQLLKMANFDAVILPIPWWVPQNNFVIRDCAVFLSPSCSAKFIGTRPNPILSVMQMVTRTGRAGDKFYIGMSSRAINVPTGGQYSLQATFLSNSGTIGSKTLTFANGNHDFQTLGVYYTVPAAYTRILFKFTYQKTGGIAWFDNAALILIP